MEGVKLTEPIRIHPFDVAVLLDALPEFDGNIEAAHLPGDGTIVISGKVYTPDTSVPYENIPEHWREQCPPEYWNEAKK